MIQNAVDVFESTISNLYEILILIININNKNLININKMFKLYTIIVSLAFLASQTRSISSKYFEYYYRQSKRII